MKNNLQQYVEKIRRCAWYYADDDQPPGEARFRPRHPALFRRNHRRRQEEFQRLHKSLGYLRPVFLLFNLAVLYALFRWIGIGTLGVIIALFVVLKGIIELLFLWRLEKRVFLPIDQLKTGFEEIARGNYRVTIDCKTDNEFGRLIEAFNLMAARLQESEQKNAEYEANRKALIANISHDLKTPITSIQGYLEMLRDGKVNDPERREKYLSTIAGNVGHLNKLIDDLFLFSKLDLAKVEFKYEKVKVRAFMRDIMDEFGFELAEKRRQFFYQDRLERDYWLNIDGKRLYQALRNIIDNAVKYGPSENLIVKVELTGQDSQVCLALRDNGPGIPPDKLPHVFDRFYRVDSERAKDLSSTGLGLAIARELIEAQGGRIEVTSIEGTGTCFIVCLPTAENGKEEEA